MNQKEEQRVCDKFCVKLDKTFSHTFQMLQKALGDECLSRSRCHEWYKRFKEGRTLSEYNPRSGRPSTSNEFRISSTRMEVNTHNESEMLLNINSEPKKGNSSVLQKNNISRKVSEKKGANSYGIIKKNKSRPKKKSSHVQAPKSAHVKSSFKPTDHHSSSLFSSNPKYSSLKIVQTNERHEPLFSKKSFEDLNIDQHLASCLRNRFNLQKLTEIQEKAIPVLLENKDALVKSCTGSGKTLAYAIPIVQKLQSAEPRIKRSDGVLALVVVPTRELAIQCYECFSLLTKAFAWIVPGYVSGGEKNKSEKARIRKGINILVCTPGRLLDHIEHTTSLSLGAIKCLVIDEADRLLEAGFGAAVMKIQEQCNKERQTVLLSATLSKEVENLAGMSLTDPVYVDASSNIDGSVSVLEDLALPAHLKQYVVTVPSKLRLLSLSTFILDKCSGGNVKMLVFMCSLLTVDFHFALLNDILGSLLQEKGSKCHFFKLHGDMTQTERVEIFKAFRKKKEGVLFCTDVAARGLDLPRVDWIVQYSAPASVEIYVHRVGRTARIGKKGNSLLFLLPSENKFSELLQERNIQLNEIHMTSLMEPISFFGDVIEKETTKVLTVEAYAKALQTKFEGTVYSGNILHKMAKEAYCSYVQSYASYPKETRLVLPFKDLHLGHAAKSFCLRESPSEVGCKFSKYFDKSKKMKDKKNSRPKFQGNSTTKNSSSISGGKRFNIQRKRKLNLLSEFSSGLSELKNATIKPPKQKKFKKL